MLADTTETLAPSACAAMWDTSRDKISGKSRFGVEALRAIAGSPPCNHDRGWSQAITIARSLSDSFAGIAPADVPGFIVAQLADALAGSAIGSFLFPRAPL